MQNGVQYSNELHAICFLWIFLSVTTALHLQWRNTIFHARHPKQYALYVLQIIVSLVSWSYQKVLCYRKLLYCFTLLLVNDSVSKQAHVSKVEVAWYVLYNIQIIVSAVWPFVIEWLYWYAVLMLKHGVKQSPIGVSARVSHNKYLERSWHQEL